ncbi:MAG: hypothetical protein RLZZ440_1058 [Planctomycetota bacterium]|jgi:hypothetical protein
MTHHASESRAAEAEPRLLPLRGAAEPTRLRRLIEGLVAEAAEERRARSLPAVAIEIDVADGHATAIDADLLRAGLLPLIRAACQASALAARGDRSRRPGEVVVTSIDSGVALEVEVADSGSARPEDCPAATVAALGKARACIEHCGGGIDLAACPEGGLAVTLRIPHRRVRGLAA